MEWWRAIKEMHDEHGTDAETRAAVVVESAAAAAADGYRKGYEEAERQLLFTLKYLPPEVDVREFVDRLIEKRLSPRVGQSDDG